MPKCHRRWLWMIGGVPFFYDAPLTKPADVKSWIMEGPGKVDITAKGDEPAIRRC